MKNDALLKALSQQGIKPQKSKLQSIKKNLITLDSGALVSIKGGDENDDRIVRSN